MTDISFKSFETVVSQGGLFIIVVKPLIIVLVISNAHPVATEVLDMINYQIFSEPLFIFTS